MELYQRIVLGIAIVLLIAAYIMIYFTLVDNVKKWPPTVAKCPDYWVYDVLQDKCKSNGNVNNKNGTITYYPSIDSSQKLSDFSKCIKYKWAKENNISWDGLSYGVSMDCPA